MEIVPVRRYRFAQMVRELFPPSDLVDTIYEAAVQGDLWPDVIDRVADFSDTQVGVIFSLTPSLSSQEQPTSRWVASRRHWNLVERFFKDQGSDNLRADRLMATTYGGFLTDRDICTPEEIATHPHYLYLRETGATGNGAGTIVKVPTGDMLVMSWERSGYDTPITRDQVGRLDVLRPHLARAALVATRLGLERARAATQALQALGLPACVLAYNGRILAANERLQDMMPHRLTESAGGRFRVTNKHADQLLQEAIGRHGSPVVHIAKSIPVRATETDVPFVLHLLPIRRTATDIMMGADYVVVITPVAHVSPPSDAVLRGLFDLTAAEASVARGLVAGHSTDVIARDRNTNLGTVQRQLKAIYTKSGVSRQSELVSLPSSLRLT